MSKTTHSVRLSDLVPRRLTAAVAIAGLGVTGILMSSSVGAYSSLYTFGDSLSDAGQFPDGELGGTNTRRFTNRLGPGKPYGKVSPQLLAKKLGLPSVPSTSIVNGQAGMADGTNYAVGGYTTAQIRASVIEKDGSVVQDVRVPFGRIKDGYLAATEGVADPDALYYINGGGNDNLSGPGEAAAAANRLADAVDALAAAGATTIMVSNLPDMGRTPEAVKDENGPAWAEQASAISRVFNEALGQRLGSLDGQVDIIRLNPRALLDEVLTSPAEFGFATDVPLGQVCFTGYCNVTPYGQGGPHEDSGKLVFYDNVHPTTAAQRILADYAFGMVKAPAVLGLAPRLAVSALGANQHSLGGELRPGAQLEGVRVFAIGSDTEGSDESRLSLDSAQRGAGVGAMLPFGQGYGGLAVSQHYGKFDLDDGSDLDADGQVFSLFARQHLGAVGVQTLVSYGDFSLDLEREVRLGRSSRTLSGDPDADGFSAELRLDYRFTDRASPWYTAPFVAYRHTDVDVDGYQESGSHASALTVDSQELKEHRLEVGIMFDRAQVDGYGLYAEVALGEHLGDDPEAARVSLTSLSSNHYSADDLERGSDHYARVDAGWRMRVGENGMLRLGGGAEARDEIATHFEIGASLAF